VPLHPRVRIGTVSAALCLALLESAVASPAGHADTVHVLASSSSPWTAGAADRGPASVSSASDVRVYLASHDPQGLTTYAAAVSDPRQPTYRQYLTSGQFERRYGPTPRQVADVVGWLRSGGLRVVATNDHYVSARGAQAAIEQAFGTDLHDYAVNGQVYYAPSAAVSVPASVGSSVSGVSGLDDAPDRTAPGFDDGSGATAAVSVHQASAGHQTSSTGRTVDGVTPTDAPPVPAFDNSGPFSSYYGSNFAANLPSAYGAVRPYAVQGYTGAQPRAAYGATGKQTGAGVSVAVIAAYASPTIVSDAARYAGLNGGASYRSGQLRKVTPTSYNDTDVCGASDWFEKQSLDVEAVHAVAPAADITLVSSASCHDTDQFDPVADVVDKHLADIVSNSWFAVDTASPAEQQAFEQLFQQAAVEGIGFYFGDGDSGDQGDLGDGVPDFPGSDPWVTSVGGTTLASGAGNSYLWETGWGTNVAQPTADTTAWDGLPGSFGGGTGGGVVLDDAQPSYQVGVVPDSLSKPAGAAAKHRVVPDIAADVDPATGMLVGDTAEFPDGTSRYNQHRIGGTSLAAPIIAAVQALAQQAQGEIPLGFANPAIYQRYGTVDYHDATGDPLRNA
jgi:subtilase family serine protease